MEQGLRQSGGFINFGHYLRPFLRITLAKKIGALLLLPFLASVLSIQSFRHYLERTRTDSHFMNVVGRQRMLAAELRDWSHMVAIGQEEDRPGLKMRITEFDESLRVLQSGGRLFDENIAPAPAEIRGDLAIVAKLWGNLKPDLLLVANLPPTDARISGVSRRVATDIDELKSLSHRVVVAFEKVSSDQDIYVMRVLMGASVFFCALFVFGVWMTRRYIVRPVLGLNEAAQRIGAGDFSGRLDVTSRDELSVLASTFNKMAAQVRQLLAALDMRRKHAEVIIESIPAGLVVLRDDMTVVRANSYFCKMFGIRNVKNKVLTEFIPSGTLRRALQEVVASGEAQFGLRVEQTDAIGAMCAFKATITGTGLAKEEEERILLVVEDLSKEVQQERALVASSKMVALGEMAGGLAHEINNPLAIIQTKAEQLLEVLEDQPVDKNMVTALAAAIVKTTDRIARIVRGLRLFSRDGSNDPVKTVNVLELVNDTLGLCGERFRNSSIDLRVREIEPGLSFEGRVVPMSQVLLNLLNNAFDAVSGLQDKWVEVSAIAGADFVEIRVTDSGSGVSSEVKRKLFQPFFTTKEPGKGTGMGLSISLGIVESHKGQLFLDAVGEHTSFVIRLPNGL